MAKLERKEYLIRRENIRERIIKEEQKLIQTFKERFAKATSQQQLSNLNRELSKTAVKKRDKYFRLISLLRERYPNWKLDWD